MLKVTISGVRGKTDESLTPEVILDFAKAFGTYLKGKKIVVGSDTRASGEYIKGIVFSGLLSCGCKIIDLGIVTTPTVGVCIKELKAAGGIVITASHNPNPWNGLKFIDSDGIFLTPKNFERLVKIYDNKKFITKIGGTVESTSKANNIHIKRIREAINPRLICKSKFKVVIDSCNGAGSIVTPKLLKALGCRVVEINTNPNKPFPHGPEPTPQNLKELSQAVIKNKADIGFAQDPDADRLSIVTNKGEAISEEYTLALAALFVNPKKMVVNLSTSNLIEDVAPKVFRTKIGEVHVATKIKKLKALLGGEGNGGVIYTKVGYNRDSLSGIALILALLAKKQISVGDIIKNLPSYTLFKTKIECNNQKQADKILNKAKKAFKNYKLDLQDGIKISFEDGWVQLRASNTEPVLRIFAEAKTGKKAKRLFSLVQSEL